MDASAKPVAVRDLDGSLEKLPEAISIELKRAARKARYVKPVTSGGGFRARPADKIYRRVLIGSFAALFLLPSLLVATYLWLFAADQYVSEARFAVKSGETSALEGLASLSSIVDTGVSKDGLIIADFVESRAMVEALAKDFDLRRIFRPDNGDFVGQLGSDSTMEALTRHWKSVVSISVNRTSGLISLDIRAFSPEESLNLAKAILTISESMVNRLNNRNELDTLQKSSEELERAKSALETAVKDLREAREAAGVLDVNVTAKIYGDIVGKLRLELANNEREISTLTETNAGDAPRLVALRAKSAALSDQITDYERKISGAPTGGAAETLAQQAERLSQKELDLKIAQANYASAMAAYKKARIVMERQQSYIQTYVAPTLADTSIYPKRGLSWLAITLAAALVWCIFAGLANLVYNNMAS